MAVENKPDPQELLKKADQLRLGGAYDSARALLEQLIQQNPFLAPAKLSLGRVYFESGDLANAKVVLEEFAEFVPDHSLANKILAKIYIYFSQHAKAREKINMVLSSSPDDSMAKKMLQEIEEADSFQEENLDDDETKKNTIPVSTATIAEIYRSQGHLKESLEIYKDLLKQNADHPIYQQKVNDLEAQLAPAKKVSPTAETAEIQPDIHADEPESSFPKFQRVEVTDEREIKPIELAVPAQETINETVELEPGYEQSAPVEAAAEIAAQVSSDVEAKIQEPLSNNAFRKTRQQKLERMLYLVQQHRKG